MKKFIQHFLRLQCTSPMTLLSSTLRFVLFTINHISHHRASPIISSTQSGYEPPLRRNFLHSEDHVLKFSLLSLRKQIELNQMQFKNKLCKMKANLKYKLAESFCRNFAESGVRLRLHQTQRCVCGCVCGCICVRFFQTQSG